MNLHPNILNAFQEIDAALFSGDSFYSPENKKELERYILRWNQELKNLNERENEKRVYHYMVNSEIKEYSEPLYWYKWNRGGGHTVFGGAYTESQFQAYKTLKESDNLNWPFTNISREEMIEVE